VCLSTFTVINLGEAGTGSGLRGDLRYAINTANANGDLSNQIIFEPGLTGTIRLTLGKLVVSKALALFGPGLDALTVSGNHQSGVFDIEAPAGQTVIFSDLTIADGTGSGVWQGRSVGGGLFNEAATVILNRAAVSGNTVPSQGIGGGIFNDAQGSMVLNASRVSNNSVRPFDGYVGAIENFGTMALYGTTVSGNSDVGLGGDNIENSGGTLTIDHSLVTGNTGNIVSGGTSSRLMVNASTITYNTGRAGTVIAGAGIENSQGRATITDSTIAYNSTDYVGGGLYNLSGQMTVTGCTIAGNTALYGGGVDVADGHVQIINSTISGNTVQNEGGGLWAGYAGSVHRGVVDLISVTITGNTSLSHSLGDGGGGGAYFDSVQALHIRNSIVAGNTAAANGPDMDGDAISLGHNLIGQTDDSTGWVATDLTGTSDDPLDPCLGPLEDNGGPTMTHALLAGSPALGAGDPLLAGSADQRGSVRVASQPLDIGAFQTEDAVSFLLLAPSEVNAGEVFSVTVVALDQWGNTASTYTGTVHFSSTDLFALLPGDTAFSGADGGAHTFNVALLTRGTQQIGVVDTHSTGIAGSTTVDVSPAPGALGSQTSFADLVFGEIDGSGWHRRRA
jgi:hypothetical protein